MSRPQWVDELRAGAGFLGGLRPFFRKTLDPSDARRILDAQLAGRAQTFSLVLRRAIFEKQKSPYKRLFDWALLAHESAYHASLYDAVGASDRPLGIWQPAPPGAVGIKTALMQAKLGRPTARWFSQNQLRAGSFKHAAFTRVALFTARLFGARIAMPEYTPAADASRVAAWLAQQTADGTPALDGDQVVGAVLEFLRSRGIGEEMMADVWAQSRTLEVVRQAPYVTSGGKILPLQMIVSPR